MKAGVRRLILGLALTVMAVSALPPLWFAAFPEPVPKLPPPGRSIPVGEGISVNAIERGVGPPVVLVHGLPGSAYDWTPLIDALAARGRHVLAYDRLGYGRSDARPDDDFTVEANARELLRLLESADLADVTLVGWSYGGAISIRAAGVDSSRIARLVLVASVGPGPEHRRLSRESPANITTRFLRLRLGSVLGAWINTVPPVVRSLQRGVSEQAFSGQPMPDWWLPQLRALIARPETRRTFGQENVRFDAEPLDPAAVARPVLVIHGDDDRLAPLENGRWIHKQARDSRLVVIKGGSHALPITHTELLADRIARLRRQRLSGTPPSPPARPANENATIQGS